MQINLFLIPMYVDIYSETNRADVIRHTEWLPEEFVVSYLLGVFCSHNN